MCRAVTAMLLLFYPHLSASHNNKHESQVFLAGCDKNQVILLSPPDSTVVHFVTIRLLVYIHLQKTYQYVLLFVVINHNSDKRYLYNLINKSDT